MKDLAALNPFALGLIFVEKSKRKIDLSLSSSIKNKFKNIKLVGVFMNHDQEFILSQCDAFGLNMVQLHGNESVKFCKFIKSKIPIIKTINGNDVKLQNKIDEFSPFVDYFLMDNLENNLGGTGKHFNHKLLFNLCFPKPFFIAGGICFDDVHRIKKYDSLINFEGFDINSNFEIKPGVKNISLVKSFIQSINYETR